MLVIGGPTAAGKTDLAIELAERYDAALVSADAMQVYRGLDIGTGKPRAEVLARHPHACIDVRDLDQGFTVADFIGEVRRIAAAHARVIVVGGTPFYLRALVRPLAALPPADPAVRARFEALDDPYARLIEVDPETAARLHPNDRVRIVRALEVHALTGRPLSELHRAGPRGPAPPAEVAWLDRPDLRQRIDRRLERMVADGYVEEVRRVVEAGWDPNLKPLRSFAYRHLIAHVQGEIELDEALRRTARDTWRLARKQRTWARSMGWRATGGEGVIRAAERAFLAK